MNKNMKKGMNKKAQSEGVGLGTILALVIGGIAVVVIILFFTGFFDTLNSGLTTFTPEQIDLKVIACQGFANSNTIATFCNFQEIDKNTYMNCQYDKIIERLVENANGLTCTESEVAFCTKMKTEKGTSFNDKITVNGKSCKKLGVTA